MNMIVDILKETWKNKDKFYEDTKGLSILEIVKGIEKKYEPQSFMYKTPENAHVSVSVYERPQLD